MVSNVAEFASTPRSRYTKGELLDRGCRFEEYSCSVHSSVSSTSRMLTRVRAPPPTRQIAGIVPAHGLRISRTETRSRASTGQSLGRPGIRACQLPTSQERADTLEREAAS